MLTQQSLLEAIEKFKALHGESTDLDSLEDTKNFDPHIEWPKEEDSD